MDRYPPIIDGVFASGEWSNPQITMKTTDFPLESYVYFENDASNLYYIVDVVGDNTDSKVHKGSGTFFDESLLVFNFANQVGVRFHPPFPIQLLGVDEILHLYSHLPFHDCELWYSCQQFLVK